MKKVTTIIIALLLVQICSVGMHAHNLDAKGNGFQIQDPLEFGITNPEQFRLESFMSEKEDKYDTVVIQTSAVCKMCKERIEHDMAFEKGVKSVNLSLEDYKVTIVYKKGKTTDEDLKKAITKIGYDADEMVANQKAHDRLPDCCQKDVEPH